MDGWVKTAAMGTLVVGGLLFGVAAALAWRRRDAPAADMFALVAGLSGVGALAVATVVAVDAPSNLLLAVTGSVGLLVPVPWVLFSFEYTGRTELVSPSAAAAIGSLPGAGVIGLTLFVAAGLPVGGSVSEGAAVAMTVLGTIQTLALLYTGALVLVGSGLLLWTFYRYEHLAPVAGTTLAGVGTLPWLSTVVGFQVGLLDPRALGASVAVGTLVGSVAALATVTRLRLFDAVPAAGAVGPTTVIEELDDVVVVVDDDGTVVDLNDAARESLEAGVTEAVGADVAAVLDASLSTLRHSDTVELQSTVGRRLFEPTVSDLTDQHDRRLGHAVVLRDVTARTTRQQRLEVLNRVLRHNLRNDVNAIVGYSDLLADDPDEPEPLADAIVEVADELAAIGEKARRIERLMATAESEAEAVPLAPLAQNVLVSAAADAPDVTYERSVPTDVVVQGSGYLLEHALRNLVENAVEHNDATEPTVELRGTYEPEQTYPLTISVLDNGPGIPEQDRAAVLDGDETPLEHGSGLGLWVVRWAVTRLGGEIDIDERSSGGTRVSLRFPRASRRSGTAGRARAGGA